MCLIDNLQRLFHHYQGYFHIGFFQGWVTSDNIFLLIVPNNISLPFIIPKRKDYAWVTLVMHGDTYAITAMACAAALREHKTQADLVCMVTEDVSSYAHMILQRQFDYVITVPYLSARTTHLSEKQERLYGEWKDTSFTKWQCLNLTIYRKIAFIDADIIAVTNIDDLFTLQTPAACFSTPWAFPFARPGLPNYYLTYDGKEPPHGSMIHYEDIEQGFLDSFVFNGGLVVLTPNRNAFMALQRMLAKITPYGHKGCVSMFDEQSLTQLYHHVHAPWYHISQVYNWFIGKENWLSLLKEENKNTIPKTWHYYGQKPWLMKREAWPDLKVWWAYVDKTLDRKEFQRLLHGK